MKYPSNRFVNPDSQQYMGRKKAGEERRQTALAMAIEVVGAFWALDSGYTPPLSAVLQQAREFEEYLSEPPQSH